MLHCDFANRIAALCFLEYNKLPKTGKPNIENQWTILSCIIEYNTEKDTMKVVSMGSGSKCLGRSQMSMHGDKINDSHSEVLARRGFLRYIYDQMLNEASSFTYNIDQQSFSKNENVTYHFFTTQIPCGDGSIFPKPDLIATINIVENESKFGKRKQPEIAPGCPKKIKSSVDTVNEEIMEKEITGDIYRTGAKCLESSEFTDPKKPGREYHILGAIRTKPGRGDPTLSVSCSDKLSRWNMLGIQGALLSLLLKEPIYFDSIIISSDAPYSKAALQRAILGRWNVEMIKYIPPYKLNNPNLMQSRRDLVFIHSKKLDREQQPCPSGVIWCNVQQNPLEVVVNGVKQGVTKAMLKKNKGNSLVCKKELLKKFFDVVSHYPGLCVKIFNQENVDRSSCSYAYVKSLSCTYQNMWKHIRRDCFNTWANKSDAYNDFYI